MMLVNYNYKILKLETSELDFQFVMNKQTTGINLPKKFNNLSFIEL